MTDALGYLIGGFVIGWPWACFAMIGWRCVREPFRAMDRGDAVLIACMIVSWT